MAKKEKKVREYDVGGDVRRARGAQASPMFEPRPLSGPGAVMPGSSATGEVGQIRESADRASQYLSEAEQAIGRGAGAGVGGIGNVLGGAVGGGMKKGGKVKKKKAKKSYNMGSKVRGAGKATQGVRKCKYVSMKGS